MSPRNAPLKSVGKEKSGISKSKLLIGGGLFGSSSSSGVGGLLGLGGFSGSVLVLSCKLSSCLILINSTKFGALFCFISSPDLKMSCWISKNYRY